LSTKIQPIENHPDIKLLRDICRFVEGDIPEEKRLEMAADYLEGVAEPELVAVLRMIEGSDRLTIRELYDMMAGVYDQAFPDRSHAGKILDLLPEGSHFESAVDLGCGTGASITPILCVADSIIGIDFSEAMLDIAREKIKDPRVRFIKADFMAEPPEEARGAGLVASTGVSRHVPLGSEPDYFRFIAGTLRPGGIALVSFITRRTDLVNATLDRAVERWMQARGLSDRRWDEPTIRSIAMGAGLLFESGHTEPSKYLYTKLLAMFRKVK
jgi:SAM-dependent methyltransferase